MGSSGNRVYALFVSALLLSLVPCDVWAQVPQPPGSPQSKVPPSQRPQPPVAQHPPAKTAPQTKQILPSYEGTVVSSIEVAGQPHLDQRSVQSLLAQKVGQPFSQAKIDQSVAALKNSGRFKDVQVQVVPEITGVRVMLVVQPGIYFGMYQFPGAESQFSYSQLLQISDYPPEGPYSDDDVTHAKQALERFFQRNGYFEAKVTPALSTDPSHGLVNVRYITTLGRKAKFGNVILQGATPDITAELQAKTKSLMARVHGAAVRPGKTYSLKTLQKATRYLESALEKQDRYGATVKLIGAKYDPETHRADVTFHVTPGLATHVKIEGAHLWSWTKRKVLPIYQQLGSDEEIIQEGRLNLVSYFQAKGYFDAQVNVSESKQDLSQVVDYHVTKGPRHKVKEVEVAGNTALNDTELLPHVAVKRGRLLSHGSFSEKLVRASVKNLENIYKAAGFSSVKVTPQTRTEGGNLDVTFHVTEGPRDTVEALKVEGNDSMPIEQLVPAGLKVREGQPFSQKLVDQDRTNIMARYMELGYLTATFREVARETGKNSHRVDVTYRIYEGPKVMATNVVVVGQKTTQLNFIDKTAKLKANQPVREDDVLSAETRLYEPGIFDWAEVDPRRQITTQDREEMVVKVHEAKRNIITYGFGFEVIKRGGSIPGGTVTVPGIPPVGLSKSFRTSETTFYGPRGSFEYTRKNLFGKAQTFKIGGLAGRLDQRANITFTNPHFRGSEWESDLTATGEHDSTNPIFTSRLAEGGWQLQKPLNAKKTTNVFLKYNLRETGLTRLLSGFQDLVPPRDRHVRLSTLSGNITRDTRDNALDAHTGMYNSLEIDLNPSFLGSSVDFARMLAQAAYYRAVPRGIIWASSLRVGFQQPFNGSHVPLAEEFFSGGGSTLRGFPLNGAGPQRTITICGNASDPSTCSPTTVPVGGNQLVILNSEFRIPLPIKEGLSAVTFYDGGNVFRSIGFKGQYTNSVGLGLRYSTPVGPIRIDIGHNMNAPRGVSGIQYFITLGQAF